MFPHCQASAPACIRQPQGCAGPPDMCESEPPDGGGGLAIWTAALPGLPTENPVCDSHLSTKWKDRQAPGLWGPRWFWGPQAPAPHMARGAHV